MNDESWLRANIVLRPYGDFELREVALGLQPIILIEGKEENGEIVFDVDATGLDRDDLAKVLRAVQSIIENGVDA